MKPLILALTAAAIASAALPSFARAPGNGALVQTLTEDTADKRRKPRIKGGSGCDDAQDIIEHPECR